MDDTSLQGTPMRPPPAGESDAADDAFIERLHELVRRVGSASALARRAGISHSGLSRYMSGGDPSRRVLVALATAAEVRVEWLATGEGALAARHTGPLGRLSPMGGKDADGVRRPTRAELPDTLSLVPYFTDDDALLHERARDKHADADGQSPAFTAHAFCHRWLSSQGLDSSKLSVMRVRGDSMSPTMRAGNIVLIDVSAREIEDDRVYLIRDAAQLLIRRLQREIGGHIRVLADNPQHREFVVTPESLEIQGRVVWCGSVL